MFAVPLHPRLLPAVALLAASLAGCATDLMRTDVVQPLETKLTYYKTVEVPLPEAAKGIPPISNDLQQRILNEVGAMGKFKRVRPVAEGEDDTLVVQATIKKWDDGNAFLRWWGSIMDFGANVYTQYTKHELDMSGSVGDGYLRVDVKFFDKHSNDLLGYITITGLSDDPDSPRSAEDRVVHSLVKYLQARL
jgi:hypothetical protein